MTSLQTHRRPFVDRFSRSCHDRSCSLRLHESPRNRLSRRRCTATVGFKDGACCCILLDLLEDGICCQKGITRTSDRSQHACEEVRLTQHTSRRQAHLVNSHYSLAGVAELEQGRQLERPPERQIPQSLEEVDNGQIMGFGADLAEDHPGYRDQAYKDRRRHIGNMARAHNVGEPIPRLQYTAEELHVWATVLRELRDLYPQHACAEFLHCLPIFNFSEHEVRNGPPGHSDAIIQRHIFHQRTISVCDALSRLVSSV